MLAKPFRQIAFGAALNRSLDELVDAFGADLQLLVDRLANAVAHGEIGAHAERGQHRREYHEVPGGQAESDGKRHHAFELSRMV